MTIQAVVMNYRDQPRVTTEFRCEFSEALAMIHEDAAVFWDRDGHSLANHSRDHITIGIWDHINLQTNPRKDRGCVVVVPWSRVRNAYYIHHLDLRPALDTRRRP